jgi:hypothetical protein
MSSERGGGWNAVVKQSRDRGLTCGCGEWRRSTRHTLLSGLLFNLRKRASRESDMLLAPRPCDDQRNATPHSARHDASRSQQALCLCDRNERDQQRTRGLSCASAVGAAEECCDASGLALRARQQVRSTQLPAHVSGTAVFRAETVPRVERARVQPCALRDHS